MTCFFEQIISFFSWKRTAFFFWGIVTLISLTVLLTVVPSIQTGAGYNDEAWLVLMVRNQANGFWTSFSHYYYFLRNSGLEAMRIAVAVFHAAACAVFVFGVVRYYQPFQKRKWLGGIGLWMLTVLVPQVFWLGGIVLAPDYKFVAYDCALIGLGSFFCGLKQAFWMIPSGAFFVQLLFTLPQTGLLAPVLLLLLILKDPKKILPFLAGGLLGLLIFFLCISSWSGFLECLSYSGTRIRKNVPGRHGFSMLITGYFKILAEFTCEVLPAALCLLVVRKFSEEKRRRWSFILLFACLLGTFLLNTARVLSWKCSGCPVCSLNIFLVLAAYSIFTIRDKVQAGKIGDLLAAALFLILPVLFCTGTDKGFDNRLTFYIGMSFTGIAVSGYLCRDRLLLILTAFFLFLAFCAGLAGWKINNGLRFPEKTINAQSAGFPENAPVSREMAVHLKKMKQYTDPVKYICNDPLHWYVPWLLQKELLHLTSFRYYSFDSIPELLKKKNVKAEEILFLEAPEYKLPEDQLQEIRKTLHAERMERIVLSPDHHIIRFQ